MSYLAVNKLHVPRALRITVSSSVLGTSLVTIVLGHSTICVHGGEVQGTIQTARKLRDVHVEREFGIGQIEHLIGIVFLHQVQTRTDV